jgi:nicotinamide-nucleotide adenylyltransferase
VLGVLPASFNPPTSAHEALITEAGKVAAFDEILLVLDQQAMDKELIDAPLEDRLLMLLVLFGDDPMISLGIANQGLFLDKIEALHQVYPQDTQIYFIVGYDTIERVIDPIYYKERDKSLQALFSQARFLVANRGDRDEGDLKELFGREENRPFAPQITSLTLSPALAEISSSEVRSRLAEGKSVQGFVPPKLEAFLLKGGFYSRHGP